MEHIDLTDFFQTKDSAMDFTTRLADLSEQIYKSDFNLEKALTEQFGLQKKDKFLNILRNNSIAVESNAALKEFLSKIQTEISLLPVISMTIAFEPKDQLLKAIAEWFVVNTKKQVLLDITTDKNLIAGCAISFKGEFLNLSIKERFNQIIKEAIESNNIKIIDNQKKEAVSTHSSLDHFSLGR